MKNTDVEKHVKGQSIFVDDLPEISGMLSAFVFESPVAHGKILSLDISQALLCEGIINIFTYKDIDGENQVGGIIRDEELFAVDEVHFIGEPVALIIADTELNARRAAKVIDLKIEELEPVTDAREAYKRNLLIKAPVVFENGDIDKSWDECDYIFQGTVDSGGQEHLYLETQSAIAVPNENDGIKLYSSTQSPTVVQRTISQVLGIPMNKIEVDVLRLGGAFGGKEDQATHWAVMAALACHKTGKPVKLILRRHQDMKITGKRHPYSSDYKIGFSSDGMIKSFEVTYYQNAGAFADLSPAILERTLFHVTNSYYIPNVKAIGISCKTNLPPNTAFRGFGGPQAMFVIESALFNAAEKMNIPVHELQYKNLIKTGDNFHYGQKAEKANAVKCWDRADELYDFNKLIKDVDEYNNSNRLTKRGIAFMPVCFGISFTSTFLNQASALVHVYTDGSVGVSTAAIEMGQGVNAKIKSIVANTFSISPDLVKIESTNTTRIANTSATAASSGADLNGNAALMASENILQRLKISACEELGAEDCNSISFVEESVYLDGEKTELSWKALINKSYLKRINLSSHAFYATPEIYFDRTINKGRPFAYHVYGTAVVIAELDCVLGRYEIDSVYIVHDYGKSLDQKIDIGQVEGGLLQGIGWMTMEELKYSDQGKLLSNSLSTYKVPDIYSSPGKIALNFLEDSENEFGPLKSKAIGEPPLMYGIGAYFAIRNAMKAYRPVSNMKYCAPLTHEKVLMNLYSE